MSSIDLMGGYAAYTTPNAALQDLAAAGAVAEQEKSVSIIISVSLISPVTVTVLPE